MRKLFKAEIVAIAAAVAVLSACSSTQRHPPSAASATGAATSTAIALAGPPQAQCAYPTIASLTQLAQAADIVVVATYNGDKSTSKQVAAGPGGTLFHTPFTQVRVLGRQRSLPDQALTVSGIDANMDWSTVLTPGQYLLFLNRPATPVNGFQGVFRVSAGALTPECAGTTDLSGKVIQPPGSPPPAAALEAAIPAVLPPPVIPTKPSSAYSSPTA